MLLKDLPPLREVVNRYGLWTDKSLGQHFLFDFNLLDRIARAVDNITSSTILEIGPGPGGLTRALLLRGAKKIVVVEHDERCLQPLADIKACDDVGERLQIIHADALTINERELVQQPCVIVANLPYNIGTHLLLKWFDVIDLFSAMVLMFQKEVGQRVVAKPGGKEYGRLAVMSQYLCEAHILFDVKPQAFVPPPKVMSAVVGLTPRRELPDVDKALLERITQAAFGQRRKVLRSSLKQLTTNTEAWLARAGIDGQSRPEQLTVADFCRLATMFDNR